jgi:hypothetical protein
MSGLLKKLLGELDLNGVLINADALPHPATVFRQLREQRAAFLLTVKAN